MGQSTILTSFIRTNPKTTPALYVLMTERVQICEIQGAKDDQPSHNRQ